MKVQHLKNRHYPKLSNLLTASWWVLCGYTVFSIRFTEKSKYTLDKGDQMDWNKVIGRGGILVRKGLRKKENLVVWRYDPKENVFHLATTYKRRNYQMQLPTRWVKLKAGETHIFSINGFPNFILPLAVYFGGNRTAPKDLSYKLKARW